MLVCWFVFNNKLGSAVGELGLKNLSTFYRHGFFLHEHRFIGESFRVLLADLMVRVFSVLVFMVLLSSSVLILVLIVLLLRWFLMWKWKTTVRVSNL